MCIVNFHFFSCSAPSPIPPACGSDPSCCTYVYILCSILSHLLSHHHPALYPSTLVPSLPKLTHPTLGPQSQLPSTLACHYHNFCLTNIHCQLPFLWGPIYLGYPCILSANPLPSLLYNCHIDHQQGVGPVHRCSASVLIPSSFSLPLSIIVHSVHEYALETAHMQT